MKLAPWLGAFLLTTLLLVPPHGGGRAYALNYDTAVVTTTPVETVWLNPTSSVVATSYTPTYLPSVYATTYWPTSYTVTSSAYVVPSYYYVPRSFVRRRLVERPIYATTASYLPTAYYEPTTYYIPSAYTLAGTPLVSTALDACDTVTERVVQPLPEAAPRRSRNSTNENREAPPAEVRSSAVGEIPPSSEAEKDATETAARADGARAQGRDVGNSPPPPPQPAAPANKQKQAETNPPLGEEEPLALPPVEIRREARKFVTPPGARGTGTVLSGTVRSYGTDAALEGIQVILSHRLGRFEDRYGETDALGRFAVRVPEGDWAVKVAGTSGRIYPVKNISVSGGRITDDLGRLIPSLVIRR